MAEIRNYDGQYIDGQHTGVQYNGKRKSPNKGNYSGVTNFLANGNHHQKYHKESTKVVKIPREIVIKNG